MSALLCMEIEEIEEINMAVAFKGDGLEAFDLELTYPVTDEPVDLTDKKIEIEVFNSRKQPVYKFSSIAGSAGLLTITNGIVSIPKTRWNLEPGTYKAPVRITDATGFAKTYLILVFPVTWLK